MKPKEIFNSKIPQWLNVGAITIAPYVLYEGTPSIGTRCHEFVHLWQVQQSGWVKFYLDYLWQYLKGRLWGLDHYDAYMNISYEIQAYKLQAEFENWYDNFPGKQLVTDEEMIDVFKKHFK